MTLKRYAKFEEKLNLGSKNFMMNLVNFNASSGKLKICTLMCTAFVESILCLCHKSREELCGITQKIDASLNRS